MTRRSVYLLSLVSTLLCFACTGCLSDDEVRAYPDAKSQKILVDQGFDTDANSQEELANERVTHLNESALKSQ